MKAVRRVSAVVVFLSVLGAYPQDFRKQMEPDLQGSWVYNDPRAGFQRARDSGKPMMAVLRCVP